MSEVTLLEEIVLGVDSSDDIIFYPNLHLSTDIIITTQSKSLVTKQNNSCITSIDKQQWFCWSVLERIHF